MSIEIYSTITDRIITLLEKGTVPWQRPWRMRTEAGILSLPRNLTTGRAYRGINVFLLGSSGFASSDWMTYRQALAMNAQVRSGEQGYPVIFFKPVDGKVSEEADATQPKGIARLVVQYYTVFNRGQIDGLPAVQSQNDRVSPMTSIPACEALVQQMHDAPTLRHGEDRAWYSSTSDVVNMPHKDLFHTPEEYYSTLFHELIHSTGHMRRLARPGITDCCPFGSTNYSKEELVAEMGATFLSSLAGIDNLTIDNSAAYVQGWIAKLRNDRRILVQAGAAAQRAVDYITDADPSASNSLAELESSA